MFLYIRNIYTSKECNTVYSCCCVFILLNFFLKYLRDLTCLLRCLDPPGPLVSDVMVHYLMQYLSLLFLYISTCMLQGRLLWDVCTQVWRVWTGDSGQLHLRAWAALAPRVLRLLGTDTFFQLQIKCCGLGAKVFVCSFMRYWLLAIGLAIKCTADNSSPVVASHWPAY